MSDLKLLRERAFVGDLVVPNLQPHEMRECVANENLRSEYFEDPDCRAVFVALMQNPDDGYGALMRKVDAIFRGNPQKFKQCRDDASPANDNAAANNVKILAEGAREQTYGEGLKRLLDEYNAGNSDRATCTQKIVALEESTRPTIAKDDDEGRTPDELGPQVPEEENPDALFRSGFLRKGGGAFLVAETHKGKSVLSLQMAYAWAAGKDAFGIAPIRPLKIALFQTEDDEDEMRDFRDNLKRGFKEIHGWTDQDLKAANDNIRLFDTDGSVGEAFTDLLRRRLAGKNFDFAIINPLQGVFGGDLNNNECLKAFLRQQLDNVIKHEPTKCGVLFIHHTNKPPLDPRLKRIDAYIGAGGAEIANWMRAAFFLDDRGKDGFRLVATKRGKRLKWPLDAKLNQPARTIRHSPEESNLIFWLDGDQQPAIGTGKRPPKDTLEDKVKKFADELKANPRSQTDARMMARSMFGRSKGDDVYDNGMEHLDDLGLEVAPTGNGTSKVIRAKTR